MKYIIRNITLVLLMLSQMAWAEQPPASSAAPTTPPPPLKNASTAPFPSSPNQPLPQPAPYNANVQQFHQWLETNIQNQQPPANTAENATTSAPAPTFTPPPSQSVQTQTVETSVVTPPMSGPGSPPPSAPLPPPPPKKRVVAVIKPRRGVETPVVQSPPMTYEESQAIMLKSAPPAVVPSPPDSEEVFTSLLQQNVPLTPSQVIRLRQMIDSSQRAAQIPATVPPKPVSSTLIVNLAPGSTPPAIRIAQGYVSSLVFVDSAGNPWPIQSYDIGDPKASTIFWDGKSNILRIQAVTPYSEGNLLIQLVGLQTPISLELVSGQRVVDYRTDIHVPGIGPNTTEFPTGTMLPESANQLLLSVLDGVAPPGSKQLKVTGGDCQAWVLGDKMFLRTRLTVLSPGWVGKMTSPDGMFAYEMQRTSSVLVSQYGNPIELKIEDF